MTTPATFSATERPSFGAEIFVVDDDPLVGELLYGAFSSEGYQVTTFGETGSHQKPLRDHGRRQPALFLIFLCPADPHLKS